MTSNDIYNPSGPNPALDDPLAPKFQFKLLWEKLSYCLSLGLTADLNPSGGPMTSGDAPQGTIMKKTEKPSNVLEKAPILGPNDLWMIFNVLVSGKCSSKTFSHTVNFIQALSTASHGREVIAAELLECAQLLGKALLPDLDELAGGPKFSRGLLCNFG
ncbi:hypothetical protein BY996DRAFT_6409869 [Phakopsora pachyrhizi]|nr:hypothetical protein BY996DRAFT_6409869 [Phakopsora pachyrhizi]